MAGMRLAVLAGLVQELLREEAPARIAVLTEELFQAARSVPEQDGQAAELEPQAPGPPDGASPRVAALAQMSTKTGKGWIDIGKPDLADEFLEIAMSSIEKLYAKLLEGSDGEADIHVHKADVEKNLFKVLSYQAESGVAQGDYQKAVMCVQRCKDMLMKLPKETCYLSILCYNFGVETYELKRYEQSSFWLSQSYDIGKMDMKYSLGKEMQAKVLRLLATAYFEWDCNLYLDKALKAVSLANQVELLSQALQHLQACKEIWKILKLTGDFAKDPTDTLLLLYEFEARSKLNDPALHNLMESVWEQPQIEVKTLEIIASLAMESPARYPVLCKKALKSALNLHRKQTAIDVEKFSKCLHSLINLSLPTGLTDLDACVLQEAWNYFEDGLSIISSTDTYPEMEILWLMTRAWNTGIFQYTVGKCREAEQWCGLGMRFLSHLGSLKKTYEGHMIGLYSEVLDKLDRAKGFLSNKQE